MSSVIWTEINFLETRLTRPDKTALTAYMKFDSSTDAYACKSSIEHEYDEVRVIQFIPGCGLGYGVYVGERV